MKLFIIPLSKLTNDYLLFTHFNLFQECSCIMTCTLEKILPIESTDYSGQQQFSKDNSESDGARLITSLSSCIINQSISAVDIISIALYLCS